jgi:hypothetical protein
VAERLSYVKACVLNWSATENILFASKALIPSRRFNNCGSGFYATDLRSLWQKFLMFTAVPLRRELIRPWFRVVARIGGAGSEESFLDPGQDVRFIISEELRAKRDGELFLFVNDAVIGAPKLYDLFYKNNLGSTRVLIVGHQPLAPGIYAWGLSSQTT